METVFYTNEIILDADIADADALLLLENIKVLNYVNGNRFVGFSTNETLEVMKVPLADICFS